MKRITRAGFTLIELLVVIAIIGILAAVVLASLNDARASALDARAQGEMRQIHTAMELLYNDAGLYPHKQSRYCPPEEASGNEVDLTIAAAGLAGTDGTYQNWRGPYFTDAVDPWGNSYYFDEDYFCTAGATGCRGIVSTDATNIVSAIISCGPDGMIGDDPGNPQPGNGAACAYNDDNIVYILCTS